MRRVMYVEQKTGLSGPCRIGWVEFSKTGRTYHYAGRHLRKIGNGYKYNCIDEETGDHYWMSEPHKSGADKLYGGVVQIDEDARVEYWVNVRRMPWRVAETEYRAGASTRTGDPTRRDDLSRRRKQTGARTR